MDVEARIRVGRMGMAIALACLGGCAEPDVREAEVPEELFTLEGEAMAVVPAGPAGAVSPRTISLERLRQKFPDLEDVYLLHYTPDSVSELDYSWQDTAITARLAGAETYLVIARRPGRISATYDALCLLQRERSVIERFAPNFLEPICQVILCAGEPIRASSLVEELPDQYRASQRVDFGAAEIGGFGSGSDICLLCGRFGDSDLLIPSRSCFHRPRPAAPSDECVTYVFQDDFEADALSDAPSLAPSGPPPDDALDLSTPGNIRVILSAPLGSKAAIIRRGSTAATAMSCITGGAVDSTGSYLVSFKGYSGFEDADTPPVTVKLESSGGDQAFRLTIDDGNYVLLSGSGSETLSVGYTPDVPDLLEFRIDLDADRFSLDVNGTTVASDRPFVDAEFLDIKSLTFEHTPPALEAFSAIYVVDEIKICRT